MSANQHLGEVDICIGAEQFTLRLGVDEIAQLETKFEVVGIQKVWKVASDTTYDNWRKFAKVALSRHHPDLTDQQLSDILDFSDRVDNRESKPYVRGLDKLLNWSMPAPDPNAQPAATKTLAPPTQESTTSE